MEIAQRQGTWARALPRSSCVIPRLLADIAHFGNIRGTKEFEDHEFVIILGARAAERQKRRKASEGNLVRHGEANPVHSG